MATATRAACGGCGRAMRSARPHCVYCGWSDDPQTSERRPVGVDRFRCGHTRGRFVLLSLLLAPLVLSLAGHAVAHGSASAALAVLALAVPGPLVLLVQLARRGAVRTGPDGVVLPDGQEVAWAQIASVEQRMGLGGEALSWESLTRRLPRSILRVGFPVLFVYYVLLPAVALLSPLHPRVVVRLSTGAEVTLPDLERPRAFCHTVRDAVAGFRSSGRA